VYRACSWARIREDKNMVGDYAGADRSHTPAVGSEKNPAPTQYAIFFR